MKYQRRYNVARTEHGYGIYDAFHATYVGQIDRTKTDVQRDADARNDQARHIHATVEDHVRRLAITPDRRLTPDDLDFAATWLENYEGSPTDDEAGLTSMASVAAWLRRQAEARRNRATRTP